MRENTADLAHSIRSEHGEGPVWDDRRACLYWVDISGRAVHRFDPSSGRDVAVHVDQRVGAVALRTDGTLLVAAERGLAVLDPDEVPVAAPGSPDGPVLLDMAVAIEADRPDMRANDGAVDPAGRYWIGTMALDARAGAGTLYRVDTDRSVHPQLTGLSVSNGIAWAPDGTQAWFVDSPTQRVDELVVDPDNGDVVERRPAIDLSGVPGVPDGMTIDAEGGLWIAMYGGWQVRRYGPDGEVDRVVRLPTAKPTSCALGGNDLDEVWITTTTEDLDGDELDAQPEAGSLFTCLADVPGVPARRSAV